MTTKITTRATATPLSRSVVGENVMTLGPETACCPLSVEDELMLELNAWIIAEADETVVGALVAAAANAYTLPSIDPTYTEFPDTAGEDETGSPVV
jgi:hypothetical protein